MKKRVKNIGWDKLNIQAIIEELIWQKAF
jgi:hypothetical protein